MPCKENELSKALTSRNLHLTLDTVSPLPATVVQSGERGGAGLKRQRAVTPQWVVRLLRSLRLRTGNPRCGQPVREGFCHQENVSHPPASSPAPFRSPSYYNTNQLSKTPVNMSFSCVRCLHRFLLSTETSYFMPCEALQRGPWPCFSKKSSVIPAHSLRVSVFL